VRTNWEKMGKINNLGEGPESQTSIFNFAVSSQRLKEIKLTKKIKAAGEEHVLWKDREPRVFGQAVGKGRMGPGTTGQNMN